MVLLAMLKVYLLPAEKSSPLSKAGFVLSEFCKHTPPTEVHSFIQSLQVSIKTNLLAELKHQAPN